MLRTTSYTNEQLSNLIIISNHKITLDGDYFVWSRDIGDAIETCIKDFDTKEKAQEWLYYNIGLWKQELNNRIEKQLTDHHNKQTSRKIHLSCKALANGGSKVTYKALAHHTKLSVSTIRRRISNDDKHRYIR